MPRQPSERKSIWVFIKLDGGGFASLQEFDLRTELEDAVEEHDIGEWEGSGSGGGWMDFSFSVENMQGVEVALAFLKNRLTEYKVSEEVVRIEVLSRDDRICEELPDFVSGDCLSYRFEDGEYGAALVLKQGNQPNTDTGLAWQTGMPPASSQDGEQIIETLIGVLDYKDSTPPPIEVFEQRNWLVFSHGARRGEPYIVRVSCFGGIAIQVVHHISLKNDVPMDRQFYLDWEKIPEYFIRDKYRGNKALNPYERIGDYTPDFQPGDCLGYRFEDGEYGAALVLNRSKDAPNRTDTLIGILNYKHSAPPPIAVFEQRNWLKDKSQWRKGEPYIVWAAVSRKTAVAGVKPDVIHHIALNNTDPATCLLRLYWEDIPEHVARQIG